MDLRIDAPVSSATVMVVSITYAPAAASQEPFLSSSPHGRHHPRKRAIQYSSSSVMGSRRCGVLDTPRDMTARLERRGAHYYAPEGKVENSLRQRELQQQRALEQREIIVGDHRQHGVALGREVDVDAFHVVDLVPGIGLEDRGAIA